MSELIIALDMADADKALKMAENFKGVANWLKIGLELFISAGPDLVEKLKKENFNIFLDLKFYDIPHTVAQAVKAAGSLGANMLTLHCQGGIRMCMDAKNAAAALPCDQKLLLLGVTTLTSFAAGEMPGINLPLADYATGLACLAYDCGLSGVVCPAPKAAMIKERFPGLLTVCPGIRLQENSADDQRDVSLPQEAKAADFIVVGRPILQADNPRQMARKFQELNFSHPL